MMVVRFSDALYVKYLASSLTCKRESRNICTCMYVYIEIHTCVYTWASLVAQLVKNLSAMQETPVQSWDRKFPWRRARLPTPVFLGFPGDADSKESACNARDLGLIPG